MRDHWYLKLFARLWGRRRASNDEVWSFRVDCASLRGIGSIRWLQWLGHLLRISIWSLSQRALRSLNRTEEDAVVDNQRLRESLKMLASSLAAVWLCRLPSWNRNCTESYRLETLRMWLKTRANDFSAFWNAVVVPHLPPIYITDKKRTKNKRNTSLGETFKKLYFLSLDFYICY